MAEGGRVYAAMVASGDFAPTSRRATRAVGRRRRVLIYAGNLDPLLGAPVVAGAVDAVAGAALANATKRIWRVAADDADPGGYATCVDAAARLCFVVVRNSGHEAPSYAPRSAYDLHARFVRRLPFDGAGRRACGSDGARRQARRCPAAGTGPDHHAARAARRLRAGPAI
ncbi:serine carboxypeptidase [Aureococcus anophagefferens]|nr:serine carboxypeptidase [Aureococcus anophagefferens]